MLSSGAERREVRAASTVRASLFLGSCTNPIACALCETWKSAFSSHPLRQPPPLLLPLLRQQQRQLLGSRGKDQSSREAADPPPAGPGLAEHAGELEDSALLESGEEKGRTVLGLARSLKGSPGLPRARHEAERWKKVQGLTLQPTSFLLLPLCHAHGLEKSGVLHTSMPAAT